MPAFINRFPRVAIVVALLALSALVLAMATSVAPQASASVTVSNAPSASTPYCSAELTPGSHAVKNAHCYSSRTAMAAAVPAATVVISIDYENASYGGATLVWYGSSGCSYNPEYLAPSMPSGWNDVVSSYRDYSNCGNNPHYENNNYGGAVVNCGPNCGYVGSAMNDRTSSEKWGN